MKTEIPNVRELTDSDWEFIAQVVDKNPEFCKWLGYTPTVWAKRIENGKYNRIWEKDGKKGLIVVGGLNSFDECLYPRQDAIDVQIKLYYYSLPSNEELELQYLQELGKHFISPLKESGLNPELEIISVDGNSGKEEGTNTRSGATGSRETKPVVSNAQLSSSKTSATAKSANKHNKNSNSKRPANA